MPYNGSGVFVLPSGNPVVTGTIISSTWANNTLADLANNGLSNALTKDGQQTPTANIPLGGFRLTNVGNASVRTDAPNSGQIQDGTITTLGTVSGTDTITATSSPSITAYAAGQCFDFIAAGPNATGVVTLNINALGAKAVTKYGAQGIQAGDIVSGQSVRVRYDGTQFQMISPASAVPTLIGSVRSASMIVAALSTSATFSAGEVIVKNNTGGAAFVIAPFSLTINLATNGANGMDTGTAPLSGYVAIYAIYNPTTGTAALLATNAASNAPNAYAGANMPSGYTASGLVSVYPTNASGQFVVGHQIDRNVYRGSTSVLNTATPQASLTSLSISAGVPANARGVSFQVAFAQGSGGSTNFSGSLSAASNGAGSQQFFIGTAGAGINNFSVPIAIPIITPQTIFYTATWTAGSVQMSVVGYSF